MTNPSSGTSVIQRTAPVGNGLPPIQIYTFGTLRVVRDEQVVTERDWHTRQARQLLKILLTERPRPVATDRLIELIWPDRAPNAAAITLRSAINALRNALEPGRPNRAPSKYIITQTPGYAFAGHPDIWLDVEVFAQALHTAEHSPDQQTQRQLLAQAVALYQDDYLTSDPYADWAAHERERLRERYFAALLQLSELQAQAGDYTAAMAAVRLVIARDQARENAYQLLMRYQAETGDSASALLTYERCRTLLAEELGADPSPLTQSWHQRILNGEVGVQQTNPATTPAATPTMMPLTLNLPAQALLPALDERGGDLFVGRAHEIALLQTKMTKALAGQGGLLLLEGEAGVGKTHLAHHLLQWVAGQGATVISTTCQPLEQQLPFTPLSDGLGRYLHTLPVALLQALPAASLGQLAQLLPSLHDRLPTLPLPANEPIANSDEQRQRLVNGLIALLTTLAEARPLVFLLDDLQWADSETLALLSRLAPRLSQLPLFLLLAYRSGDLAEESALTTLLYALKRANPQVVLPIERFALGEVTDIVNHFVGDEPLTKLPEPVRAQLVALLYQQTQGNGLFVTEALRDLQERARTEAQSAWTHFVSAWAADPQATLALEQNGRIKEIILERIGRLSGAARNLLRLCAVIGRDFSLDLLERVAPQDPVTDLELLLQRKFLLELPNDRIDFSHQIVRQVAYDQLSVLQRRRFHLLVAEALVRSPRAAEAPSEIAFHYRQAGASHNGLVAHYSVLAGERLLRTYGFHQAVTAFAAALTLLQQPNLPGLTEPTSWIRRALLGQGLAYEALFDPIGVTATYQQLQQWARQQGDRQLLLTAYSRLTSMLSLLGQQRESNESLRELIDALAQSNVARSLVLHDLFERRQRIYRPENTLVMGEWSPYLPPPPVVAEPAADLLSTLEPVHAALSLFDYGWTLLIQGQLPAASACLETVVELATQTGQPALASTAYYQLAVAARIKGDLALGYTLNERSVVINREIQGRVSTLGSMWPRIGSGIASLQQGRIDEAERRLQRVADDLPAANPHDGETFRNYRNSALIGLGLVALARGQLELAATQLQTGLVDAVNLYPYVHIQGLLGLATIAHQRGDQATNRAHLQTALHFAGQRSLLEEYVETLLAIARLAPPDAPLDALLSAMITYTQEIGLTAVVARLQQARPVRIAP